MNDNNLTISAVVDYMKDLQSNDTPTDNGECWGLVYRCDSNIDQIIAEVTRLYTHKNSVSSTVFPSVSVIERELISICNQLMHGTANTVGCVTSGATESNFLALKAYRDRAWHEKGIKKYTVMLPESAHPSFHKAAHDLDLTIINLPLDNLTFDVSIDQFLKLLNDKVIAVVLSAPSYIYGKTDLIEQIATITEPRTIPLHIDAAIGGMFFPFMEDVRHVKPFDFRVRGVRSICIDLHKYGFAPKGVSVLLYRDSIDRQYQYFVKHDYCGTNYAAPVFMGSRSPVAAACALAIYKFLGIKGFKVAIARVLRVKEKIKEFIENHSGLQLVVEPDMSVICVSSRTKKYVRCC